MGLAVLIALAGAGTAGASITISGPVSVDEPSSGTTDATFVVTRAQTLALTGATVTVTTVDGSAVDGADYTGVSQTVTLPAGILGPTTAVVTVPIKADTLDENDETFSAVLSAPTGGESLGDPSSATTTIVDDPGDVPPSVSADTPAPAVEGTGASTASLSVPVTLSAASGREVRVDYATGGGTATAGADYTAKSGTLVFAPGQTTQTVTIPVIADAIDEADETVGLSLSAPVAATLGIPASVTGTIVDDDTASLSVTGASVTEGAAGASTPVSATVSLSTPSAQAVSVHYATADGTAAAGADYVAKTGTVTIPAGQTSAPIPLTVSGDALDEPDETFSVALDSPVGAGIAAGSGVATVTILDDDPQPSLSVAAASVTEGTGSGTPTLSFPVTLSAPSGRQVQVQYATGGGTATAGSDYTATSGTLTFTAGQTAKTVTVPVLPDAVDENDETVQVTLSAPVAATIAAPGTAVGTILDDDTSVVSVSGADVAEGSGGTNTPASATVHLTVANDRAVSVHYATADGTAKAPADYAAASGTVTVPAGSLSAPIPLTVVGDDLAEDNETFGVALTAPVNATLAGGGGASATMTILDDDTTPELTVGTPAAVTEGTGGAGPSLVVPVTLSAPSGRQVSVDYATGGGTATPGSDYTAVSGTLVLAAGQTSGSVLVPITPDAVDEGDETVQVAFSGPVQSTLANPATVTGTIVDDDTATISVAGASVAEGAAGATTPVNATVMLSTPSAQDITVAYATADGTATAGIDYVARSGTVTIPAGQTSTTIALTVKGDADPEADETFTVGVDGVPPATITILDDDTAVGGQTPATGDGDRTAATGSSGTRKPPVGIIPVPVGKVRLSAPRFTRATGTLRFVVTCPTGSGRCKGTLTILSIPDRASKVRALRAERRLALRHFDVAQRVSATITLTLTARVRSWLRTVHRLKISAYAVSKNASGAVSSARRRGTLTG